MKNKCLFMQLFAMTVLFSSAPVQAQKKETNIRSIYSGNNETKMNFTHEGHEFNVKMDGKQITEMYRDGEKVAPQDYSKYEKIINEILAEAEKQRAEGEKLRQQAEVQRKEAEKMRAEAAVQRDMADKQRKEADQMRKQAEVARLDAEKQRTEADKQRKQAEVHRKEAEKQREEAEQMRLVAEQQRKQAEVHRKEAEKQRELAEKERALMDAMLDEIVAEKIVTHRDQLKEVELSQDELVVNGVKQSASLHQQFKKKYLKGSRIKFQIGNQYKKISVD